MNSRSQLQAQQEQPAQRLKASICRNRTQAHENHDYKPGAEHEILDIKTMWALFCHTDPLNMPRPPRNPLYDLPEIYHSAIGVSVFATEKFHDLKLEVVDSISAASIPQARLFFGRAIIVIPYS